MGPVIALTQSSMEMRMDTNATPKRRVYIDCPNLSGIDVPRQLSK